MSKRKVHWRPPGYIQPRARCGAWQGTPVLTRDRDKVTCKQCRRFMSLDRLEIAPVRGRPMEVSCRDGERVRGQLIDGSQAGLELCRRDDGKPVLLTWRRIKKTVYTDTE